MAWITLSSDYGDIRATCFAEGWSKIHDLVSVSKAVKFECDSKGILKEISIDGTVYKTQTPRKQYRR